MRAIKNLFVLVIIVAILAGVATVALRIARGKPSGVEEIKPGLVTASSMSAYLYAARVGNKVILFDAGADPDGKPLDAALGWLHAGRGDITDVFLTHGHGDHTTGAAGLRNAHIRLGAGDLALAEKKVPSETLAGKAMALALSYPAVTATDPITGAATFDVGEGASAKKVKAFPIPGHTPGSYAFLYDGVLFVGDAMIFKQGRLDPALKLFDAHPDQNKAAIRALQKQTENEEIDIVCTGHGGCTPKGLGRNQLADLAARI
jgi:glyoxylase-like metal-dependent hydrolase (beta-lactamase superfamily II)